MRYRYATLFVDHFLNIKYFHCMSEITSEEIIYAKKSFKRHAADFNVREKRYHCNNGKFGDNPLSSTAREWDKEPHTVE